MDNKSQLKIFSLVSTGTIALLGLFLAYWLYSNVITQSPSVKDQKTGHLEIDMENYQKITSPKTYGTKVELHEPGTGRDNPFLNY